MSERSADEILAFLEANPVDPDYMARERQQADDAEQWSESELAKWRHVSEVVREHFPELASGAVTGSAPAVVILCPREHRIVVATLTETKSMYGYTSTMDTWRSVTGRPDPNGYIALEALGDAASATDAAPRFYEGPGTDRKGPLVPDMTFTEDGELIPDTTHEERLDRARLTLSCDECGYSGTWKQHRLVRLYLEAIAAAGPPIITLTS